MIISHKYKFIFIKTNKTAGTSFELALSSVCGPEDILTPISKKDERIRAFFGFPGPQNYQMGDITFRAHTPGATIRDNIEKGIWDSYYKFCFERNPWDKVISHYYWRGGGIKFAEFDEYLKAGELDQIKGWIQYADNMEILVNHIYRFEQLEQAVLQIKDVLGLPNSFQLLPYKAKSGIRKFHGDYREFYSKRQKSVIEKKFKREIELMGYQF